MIKFSVPEEFLELTIDHHRSVQVAIALIANEKAGNKNIGRYLGIGKYEGGVKVNGSEICIRHNSVADDWIRYNNDPKPNEQFTVDAINEVVEQITKNGIEWLQQYTDKILDYSLSDPLNSFYRR